MTLWKVSLGSSLDAHTFNIVRSERIEFEKSLGSKRQGPKSFFYNEVIRTYF